MRRAFRPRGDDAELDPGVLRVLAGLASVGRDPRRREAGRAALLTAVARARARLEADRAPWWRRRRAQLALGLAGGVLAAGTGVVVAAARSLPDSPLYGIERAAEAVELHLTTDRTLRGQLLLGFAQRRAEEAGVMLRHGRDDLALDAARSAANDLVAALADLGTAEAAAARREAVDVGQRLRQVADVLLARGDRSAAAAVEAASRQAWTALPQHLPPQAAPSPAPEGPATVPPGRRSGESPPPPGSPEASPTSHGGGRGNSGGGSGQTPAHGPPTPLPGSTPTPLPGNGPGSGRPSPRVH